MDLDKFNEIIESVPDYKEFLTVDELKVNSETLAEKNKHVKIFKAGVSTEGEEIHCLKIGSAQETP